MIKNDSLQQAYQRIQELEIQNYDLKLRADSISKIAPEFKLQLLQERMGQASETIANLEAHATSFGTVYAILTVLITIVAIGVPYWINHNANKAVLKLQSEFEEKIASITKQTAEETSSLKKQITAANKNLSLNFNREFKDMNEKIETNLSVLEGRVNVSLAKAEFNSFSSACDHYHFAGNFMQAAFESLCACMVAQRYNFHYISDILTKFVQNFEKLTNDEITGLQGCEFRDYKFEVWLDGLQLIPEYKSFYNDINNIIKKAEQIESEKQVEK